MLVTWEFIESIDCFQFQPDDEIFDKITLEDVYQ